jgi:NO-binding membrane sensor protein with MHYT domain
MVHQFAYGWITPALAYALSFVGSLLGLVATGRARSAAGRAARSRWLLLAAFAIGGTGIWTMHFLAMVGFAVDGTAVRYDLALTVASWLTAVLVVGVGLFLVGFGRASAVKIIPAGILTGAGVAGMHYSGMAAMRLAGDLHYDRRYVLASVVIAVVAATVALWCTVSVRRPLPVVGAAALLALAVCGMHYVGMYGIRVHLHATPGAVSGLDPLTFLVPILVLALAMVVALFYSLLSVPGPSDREVQEELRARIDGSHPDTRPAGYLPSGPGVGEPGWDSNAVPWPAVSRRSEQSGFATGGWPQAVPRRRPDARDSAPH